MTTTKVFNCCLVAVSLTLVAFTMPDKKIQVFLVGDSTMSNKTKEAYPETGWGMPFVRFFDDCIAVKNVAQNGRSTRSFIAEDRWKQVKDSLNAGDYVLIQFGHNDEVPTKKNYTPPAEFKLNLLTFIKDAKKKGAVPILITPVSRRNFDSLGIATETHALYAPIVRVLAKEQNVPCIDLDEKSIELYNKLGKDASALLFNHLDPGVQPNYPKGKVDNTHFNELGARKIAEIVIQELGTLNINLVKFIITSKPTQ